jgi:hypothetical protein
MLKQVGKLTDLFSLSFPPAHADAAPSQTLRELDGLYIFQPSQHCPTARKAN